MLYIILNIIPSAETSVEANTLVLSLFELFLASSTAFYFASNYYLDKISCFA